MLTAKGAASLVSIVYTVCSKIVNKIVKEDENVFIDAGPAFSSFSARYPKRETILSATIRGTDGTFYRPVISRTGFSSLANANLVTYCKMLRVLYSALAIDDYQLANGVDVEYCSAVTVCKNGSVLVQINREMLLIGIDGELTHWYVNCYQSGRDIVSARAGDYCREYKVEEYDWLERPQSFTSSLFGHEIKLNECVTVVIDRDYGNVTMFFQNMQLTSDLKTVTELEIAIIADAILTNRREVKYTDTLKDVDSSLTRKFSMSVQL